ncbi:MAG: TolC family protein [Planctomycetaceae bacterium]|nr:TolC family protein [Planctomycetaceae bacterium]
MSRILKQRPIPASLVSFCLVFCSLAGCTTRRQFASTPALQGHQQAQSSATPSLTDTYPDSATASDAESSKNVDGRDAGDLVPSGQVGAKYIQLVSGSVELPGTDSGTAVSSSHGSGSTRAMDLGTVLSVVGGQHPAVGFARWRAQEAYAEQLRAQTLWLPSIQAGVSIHQHDGNLQASNGTIQDVNRSSLQAGLGAGAVGAGTTPNPGIVARFHVADAIFAPSIAEKSLWASNHAATAAVNDQLLSASLAWLELLTAEQRVAILSDSMGRIQQLHKITADFAEAGQGLQSDADRLATEQTLSSSRVLVAKEQAEVASIRLVEAISASSSQRIVPAETALVPIQLVNASDDPASLISQGLHYRPELKEAQCLVAAACERFQRQKYAPFVPSVLLGLSHSGFGGGQGMTSGNFDHRMDMDAAVTWELRGLGYGEQAARRGAVAQVEQARFRQVRLMDQVAREVNEACMQARFRLDRIHVAEQGIESAENSVARNLDRIRNGQGLPIEALQSVRALEDARLGYLQAVFDYNEAQFQLHRAIGQPVFSPLDR